MSQPRLNLDRTLAWSVGILIGAFLLFEFTSLDLWVQDRLYDFERDQWLVEASNPLGRLLFYNGPKILIIGFAVLLVASVFITTPARLKMPRWLRSRRRVIVALLTLGLVPAVVAGLKATTNVFCPSEIRRYGGDVPYVRVLETCATENTPQRRGRCFPAGHASGGFALFALAGLANTRRGQLLGITFGFGVGSLMGGYQMAKGAHYLSHTVITALLAWIISVQLMKISEPKHERDKGLDRIRPLSLPT